MTTATMFDPSEYDEAEDTPVFEDPQDPGLWAETWGAE